MEISQYPIPLLFFAVITAGIYNGNDIYGDFIDGAKDGVFSAVKILPNIIAIMSAIAMINASGFMETAVKILSPILNAVGMPTPVLTLALFRPLSGSASLSVVNDIFANFGTDSASGLIASVMMGSTETTFYTVALYFGACGIKNIRHTLFAALAADAAGIVASIVISHIYFGF